MDLSDKKNEKKIEISIESKDDKGKNSAPRVNQEAEKLENLPASEPTLEDAEAMINSSLKELSSMELEEKKPTNSPDPAISPTINIEEVPVDFTPEEYLKLKKELEEKCNENKCLLDSLIRLKAEFENYKKRMAKEKAEFVKYANEMLFLDILPVLDNLELAMKSLNDVDNDQIAKLNALKQGVDMIYKQLWSVLSKNGLKMIDTIGTKFDPYYHEAVMYTEGNYDQDGIIIDEIQKGYILTDKVIRAAKVSVGKKKSDGNDQKETLH